MGFCLSLLLTFAISFLNIISATSQVLVKTGQGFIMGQEGEVSTFKGIPYALPPVGKLRWRPPQSVPAWRDTLQAYTYGNICPQDRASSKNSGEDCLSLNIWTLEPQEEAKLPVMIWIHGGGFQRGSSQKDGEALARLGVVVVSINYRLGIFGFMAHPQLSLEPPYRASGNYGLLDQIAALKWIKENIAVFGGDPDRMTVFGESAGATSIGYLLVSPLAKGLFQGAILQSPSRLAMPDVHLRETSKGLTAQEEVGQEIGNDIDELRDMSKEEVIREGHRATDRLFGANGKGRIGIRPESNVHRPESKDRPWWAFADGWVVPTDFSKMLKSGKMAHVPLLLGTNANEGSKFVQDLPIHQEAAYREYLQWIYPPLGDSLYATYPAVSPTQIRKATSQLITDAMFLYGTQKIAITALDNGQYNVYTYKFNRVAPGRRSSGKGAYHGAELVYVFGEMANRNKFDATDRKLSKTMMNTWVNFAATGNPNGSGVPHWPAYNAVDENYMEFGDDISVKKGNSKKMLKDFDRIFLVE